jgi:hypothetical protein
MLHFPIWIEIQQNKLLFFMKNYEHIGTFSFACV